MLTTLLASIAMIPATIDTYNVVWDTPSEDAAGSMPIGNGEMVLNVWVERATGDLLVYVARSDALSEISRVLKLGRVRVHMQPSVLSMGAFRQELHLRDGFISLSSGAAALKLFVDRESNSFYLTGQTAVPVIASAAIESWRTQERELPKEEMASAWSVHDAPFPLIESADVFAQDAEGATWFHRNESSVVPKLWENQSLTQLKGLYDPILHRTFGGRLVAKGFKKAGNSVLATLQPVRSFEIKLTTHSAQTKSVTDWQKQLGAEESKSDANGAALATRIWWHDFWDRSWVFVEGDSFSAPVPKNNFEVRRGVDSNGGNVFSGEISEWRWFTRPTSPEAFAALLGEKADAPAEPDFGKGLTLVAQIRPRELKPGRIFDKLTAGQNDGFLFDTFPGDGLRLIVGDLTLSAAHVLKAGAWQDVIASYDPASGEASIYLDGRRVAHREAISGSQVTRSYLLQRYVQACQGQGEYPIKFNGGYYTVEPRAAGRPFNADWRAWGDSHWFQNLRHMYHPMLAQGDFEMMEPFWKLYEKARPLAESRSRFYHGSEGTYFPETMTVFGTYSGGDYGWDRTGHKPNEVLCPWWDDAWNQGPELVGLMLDRWDYTRDETFLKARVLPMAESVLRYFDTRFKKDARGRIILDPTQVVETYWDGVVNDMPSAAGLISTTSRLCALPMKLVSRKQAEFFRHMKVACPALPLEVEDGKRELAPAEKYEPKTSNVENGELYAVWPFRVVSLAHPELLAEAERAYEHRKNHLDVGWGYDGNVAALLGNSQEASRILMAKCRNSHPAYRWPATWGPNFDWLPDQNHGGNLLNTTNLMLLQSEPLEAGGDIRILPAWPTKWDVSFKLHAAGNTVVSCVARAGKIEKLDVTPKDRMEDVVWPKGWKRP